MPSQSDKRPGGEWPGVQMAQVPPRYLGPVAILEQDVGLADRVDQS